MNDSANNTNLSNQPSTSKPNLTNNSFEEDAQAHTTPLSTDAPSSDNSVSNSSAPTSDPFTNTAQDMSSVSTEEENAILDTIVADDASPSENQGGSRSFGSKKTIATILGILLLVSGVGVGVYLTGQQTRVRVGAWDCVNYVFDVNQQGVVTVRNGSSRNEPQQQATVTINGTVVATLDVPALNAGSAQTLGSVPVPDSGFTWQVDGSKDCDSSGTYGDITPTPAEYGAQCHSVQAYDSDWNLLNTASLNQLSDGDVVRFSVGGTTTSGSFDKARFIINGEIRPEVTAKRPGTEDFYDEYTIPANTTNFTVEADIHHSDLGWF